MPKLASPMPTRRVPQIKFAKGVHHRGRERQYRPEKCAGKDQRLSRKVVAEPSGQRSGKHIRDEESESQAADALIVHLESALHQRLHACQHIAVGVVQQV